MGNMAIGQSSFVKRGRWRQNTFDIMNNTEEAKLGDRKVHRICSEKVECFFFGVLVFGNKSALQWESWVLNVAPGRIISNVCMRQKAKQMMLI